MDDAKISTQHCLHNPRTSTRIHTSHATHLLFSSTHRQLHALLLNPGIALHSHNKPNRCRGRPNPLPPPKIGGQRPRCDIHYFVVLDGLLWCLLEFCVALLRQLDGGPTLLSGGHGRGALQLGVAALQILEAFQHNVFVVFEKRRESTIALRGLVCSAVVTASRRCHLGRSRWQLRRD